MALPNFFIIGAAKSGTSSLYNALRQHPEIYLSNRKEPGFFAFNGEPPLRAGPGGGFYRRNAVWKAPDYVRLFAGVTNQKAIGEASTCYFDSRVAAQRIRRELPHARLIALLRHPVDRAYSAYTWHRQQGIETCGSFAAAIAAESTRMAENYNHFFAYRDLGLYEKHLSVYFDMFKKENIKIYLFEDIGRQPKVMLADILRFLDVDDTITLSFPRDNVTLWPRSRRLHAWAARKGPWGHPFRFLPAMIGEPLARGLQSLDRRFNLYRPPPLDPETRQSMTGYYREDILRLQDLIGRDLSHWLAGQAVRS